MSAGTDSARSWLNAAAAFMAMFVTFGVAYSFGAFFTPIAREFSASSGATSVVLSLTAACWFLLGLVTGRAVDRWGPRPVLLAGAVALVLGLEATARAHALWLAYLAHGLGVGIAVACTYVPMLAVVSGWFARHRGLALGVAVSGIGAGTLCGAPLAAALIAEHGWRSAYQIFGVAGGVVLVGCALVSSAPPDPAGASRPRASGALADRRFWALYVGSLLGALALFVAMVYLPAFAVAHGVTPIAAATLVGVIGVASVLGRLAIGPLADRAGYLVAYRSCFVIMLLSYLIWLVSADFLVMAAFAVVLGVGYGGWIALGPAVLGELFGTAGLGGLIGLNYTGQALGVLIGPPLAGLIIDGTGGYRWAIAMAIGFASAAAAAVLPLRARH